jgi:hypothetical protein
MDFTTLQHGSLLGTESFTQLYMHVGKPLGISRQEDQQDAFDRVRWGGYLQYPPISTPENFRPLAQRIDMCECTPTFCEKLLTSCRQDETPANAVKEPEPQFLLKVAELPRKGRLPNAQAEGCFRDRA